MFTTGQQFPGDAHRSRIVKYDRWRKLTRGMYDAAMGVEALIEQVTARDYNEVIDIDFLRDLSGDVRVIANLPRLIARRLAGMTAKGLAITSEDGATSDRLEKAFAASSWNKLRRRAIYRSLVYGNGILTPRKTKAGLVVVDARDPWTWFPEASPANPAEASEHTFAWIEMIGGVNYLLQEHYSPGRIDRTAHVVKDEEKIGDDVDMLAEYDIGREVEWPQDIGTPPSEVVKYDGPLVTVLQAWTDEEKVYGDGLLDGNESLVYEVTGRLSQLANILDQHASPPVQGPADAMRKDPNGRVRFDIKQKFWGRDNDEPEYRYVAWEAQLEHAHQELDRVLGLLCCQMGMAPELIGLNLSKGAGVEATDTLRIRSFNTLAEIDDQRAFFTDAMRELSRQIVALSGGPKDAEVDIKFGDALPLSRTELAKLIQAERMAGVVSLETAVKRLNPEMGDEDVAAEIERIRNDENADLGLLPQQG